MERIRDILSDLYLNSTEKTHIKLLAIFLAVFIIFSLFDLLVGIITTIKTKEGKILQHIEISIFKIISVILLIVLVLLTLLIPNVGWVVRIPAYYVLGLLAFKEVILIMRNGMTIAGVKNLFAYHFLTSVFDILVGKFFSKLKNETLKLDTDGQQKDSTSEFSD